MNWVDWGRYRHCAHFCSDQTPKVTFLANKLEVWKKWQSMRKIFGLLVVGWFTLSSPLDMDTKIRHHPHCWCKRFGRSAMMFRKQDWRLCGSRDRSVRHTKICFLSCILFVMWWTVLVFFFLPLLDYRCSFRKGLSWNDNYYKGLVEFLLNPDNKNILKYCFEPELEENSPTAPGSYPTRINIRISHVTSLYWLYNSTRTTMFYHVPLCAVVTGRRPSNVDLMNLTLDSP